MKIALGSDHGGYKIKKQIEEYLKTKNIEILDCGCDGLTSCNYAEFGIKVGEIVSKYEADLGIVVCTSGVGISIAANKVKGIRCGLAWNPLIASLMRMHNDANVISIPGAQVDIKEAIAIVDAFLTSSYEGGRHDVRVKYINDYDDRR